MLDVIFTIKRQKSVAGEIIHRLSISTTRYSRTIANVMLLFLGNGTKHNYLEADNSVHRLLKEPCSVVWSARDSAI